MYSFDFLFSIISGCYDNTIKLWNTDSENLLTIPAHGGPVKCVSWLKQGKRLPQ